MQIDYVVCTKNSERYLETCLNSILQYGEVQDLIIVDEHSTDRTLEIAYHKYDANIWNIGDGDGIGMARYMGACLANTERIAFVDSDVELTESWSKVTNCTFPVVSGWYERPPDVLPRTLHLGAAGWIGCSVINRQLILDSDMKYWKWGEDSKFARWLAKDRGMNGEQGIPWYIVNAEMIHHHDPGDMVRYERYGRVLQDIDGITLGNVLRIGGGAITGSRMGSAKSYMENARIRAYYLKGYLDLF